MNHKLCDIIYNLTKELKDVPQNRNRHFSFIVRKNRVVSVGWNSFDNTHPIAVRCNYRYGDVHSELSAVLRYRDGIDSLRRCILVNTRINRFGDFRISKPCDKCMLWIPLIGFREIWYTNYHGKFQKLELQEINHGSCRPSLVTALS